ncbi:PIG-L family deacetylase [Actinoplanes sp. NBRC 103695]|uniref:PIG-L family deacetylase n=1 Tax=Actinoplanes sp. NBRC 103695 TaxID=3032202 RepID=UPI00255498DE|nr:PIG-L family deacetylase [Actinoplanes sp. NBRC 103695]
MRLSRRLMLALSAAGSGTALLSTPASGRVGGDKGGDAWETGPTLSIVAHPDDDLYFLNPNVSQAIRRGHAEVVSVVVTAAEGDGRNVDTDDPDREQTPVDFTGYSTARHHGLRRAYARMAGLPTDSRWDRAVVAMPDGLTVEHYVLAAAPRVQLYLLNVAQIESRGTMAPLWSGEIESAPTRPSLLLPRPVQRVTRAALIGCLAELIRRHAPAVVRTLDPDPEHDWGKPGHVVSDHADHTATARFTMAAVEQSPGTPVVEHYRAYANRFWQYNLSKDVVSEKGTYVETYAGADGTCDEPDCGDRQLGPDPFRSTHIYSTAERYRPTTAWLARDAGGTLVAVAALAGRATVWSEAGDGTWGSPERLGGGWIAPSPVLAAGADGRTHLVCLRRTELDRGRVRVDVVHAVREGGAFGAWTSLDGPTDDEVLQREVGVPAATVDGTGRLWVVVRNGRGSLSVRHETGDGGWTPWAALSDTLVQDVPAAMTTRAGLVEVLVPGKRQIYRWRQEQPGGPLVAAHPSRETPAASGALTAVETAGGRVCAYFRRPRSSKVEALREHEGDKGWPGAPADLGGHGGTGPIATVGRADAGAQDLVLVARNARYTTSLALPGDKDDKNRPRWQRLPGPIVGAPALAADRDGRLVLAVLGQDGRLHVKRATDDGFGPWSQGPTPGRT